MIVSVYGVVRLRRNHRPVGTTPLIVGSNNTITIIAAPVDAFYGSRTYMTSKTMSGGIDNPMKDSILRGDAVLHYPRTTIKAYFGDRDDSGHPDGLGQVRLLAFHGLLLFTKPGTPVFFLLAGQVN